MSRWLYQLSYGPVSSEFRGWFYRPSVTLSSNLLLGTRPDRTPRNQVSMKCFNLRLRVG